MREQKNLVNEIQKIAKEIKKIPTKEFRNQDLSKYITNDQNTLEEDDSLLEELGKLTTQREKKGNPYENQYKYEINEKAMKDFTDIPFSKVISSIESFKNVPKSHEQQDSAGSIEGR